MEFNPGGGGGGGGGNGNGNGDPPPELPHGEWILCALDLSRLPPVGSIVRYFPQGHYEQWAELLEPPPNGHLRSMICTVTALEVVTAAYAPYALVSLTPAPDAAIPPAVLPVPRATSFQYNMKNYNLSDHIASLVLPKPIYTVLPRLGDGITEQPLDMVDTKGKLWRFTHEKKGAEPTPVHFLKNDWRPFVDSRNARGNDKVFVLRGEDGRMFIELRNAANTAETAAQRLAAPPANLAAELAQAAQLSAQGQVFTATYYPHKGVGKFFVQAREVEESLEIIWEVGMEVRLRKDLVRHTTYPLNHLYTSQPPTGIVMAVTDSTWRGLQIRWDDQTTTMTSAWEVDNLGPPPRKKRRVVLFGSNIADPPPQVN